MVFIVKEIIVRIPNANTCLHIFWGCKSQTSSGTSMSVSTCLSWHSSGPSSTTQPAPHTSTGSFSQLVSPTNLPGLCSKYLEQGIGMIGKEINGGRQKVILPKDGQQSRLITGGEMANGNAEPNSECQLPPPAVRKTEPARITGLADQITLMLSKA